MSFNRNQNNHAARIWIILNLVLLLASCQSEFEIELPQTEQKIVCNGLFSADTTWRVWVGYTQPFTSMYNDYEIPNAHVFIVEKGGDTLLLNHTANGIYTSLSEKPIPGRSYKLRVQVNDELVESTWSSIPVGIQFQVDNISKTEGITWTGSATIENATKVLSTVEIDTGTAYVQIRCPHEASNTSAEMYVFTQTVFDSLRIQLADESVVSALQRLKGDTIYFPLNLENVLKRILQEKYTPSIFVKVEKLAYVGTINYKTIKPYWYPSCLGTAGLFETFNYDWERLLGTFTKTTSFSVYIDGGYEGAGWVQFQALSEEAYRYYQSYAKQLDARIDLSEGMQPVYSNMSNQVGIFAGLAETRIQIK